MPTGVLARSDGAKDFNRFFQLAHPLFAAWIVQGHDQIGRSDGFQPPANHFPGDEQVAQANHGKIEHQRCPQGGGGGAGGRHAGNDFDGHAHVFGLGQFDGQPGHAINARVARGNQCHDVARRRALQGLPAALDLVRHAGGDQLLAVGQIGDRFEVGRVADDDPAFGDRLDGAKRAVLACRRDLFQRHTVFPGNGHRHAVQYLSWGVVIGFSFLPAGLRVRRPRASPPSPEQSRNARMPGSCAGFRRPGSTATAGPVLGPLPSSPGSSALMSAEANSRTRAKSQPASDSASRTAATIVLGGRAAPAADADDQVFHGFGGRRHDRLGPEDVGHGQGQARWRRLRARSTGSRPSARRRRRPPPPDRSSCAECRGRWPGPRPRSGRCRPSPHTREKSRRSDRQCGRIARACGISATPACRNTSHASHAAASLCGHPRSFVAQADRGDLHGDVP